MMTELKVVQQCSSAVRQDGI